MKLMIPEKRYKQYFTIGGSPKQRQSVFPQDANIETRNTHY